MADNAEPDAVVYTDDAAAYEDIPNPHESVKHSVSEYVKGMAHTNGIESFWSMLKRAHKGTFHKISPKHLDRYVHEFAGKHNVRDSGTLTQMRDTVARLVGRNLLYRDLIADNGLSSAIAIYLCLTSLKSVSSMKLQRDIGVSQPTAWFMLHRIREAWAGEGEGPFDGPVEFDETYVGGKRKNMSNAKRKAATGRGPVDMVAVVGAKDRATNKVNAKVPGRKGSVRRNSAFASVSGVAPARSRAGSSIGLIGLPSIWCFW